MPGWAIGLSIFATLVSSISFLALPASIPAVGLAMCVYSMLGGVLAVMEDWFRRYFRPDASERACVVTLRASTVFLGVASITIAFAVIGVEYGYAYATNLFVFVTGGRLKGNKPSMGLTSGTSAS